jgi:hypothetical protein
MATNLNRDLQQAHAYLGRLNPEQFSAVRGLLQAMVSPEEGDTRSSAERKAVAEAGEWLRDNQPIAHAEG